MLTEQKEKSATSYSRPRVWRDCYYSTLLRTQQGISYQLAVKMRSQKPFFFFCCSSAFSFFITYAYVHQKNAMVLREKSCVRRSGLGHYRSYSRLAGSLFGTLATDRRRIRGFSFVLPVLYSVFGPLRS
jgi:hypothetical protein